MTTSKDNIDQTVKLIINADDYGISLPVNNAIDHCLKNSIINSASVMVNAPHFNDACQRISGSGYEELLGIHINLTEFKPVTDFACKEVLDDKGCWNKDKISHFRLLNNRSFTTALKKEIQAQVDIFLSTGLVPAHINTHHHCHTFPWMLPFFTDLSGRMQVPLRIALTTPTGNRLKSFYRSVSNWYIRSRGLAFSDYFENKYTYGEKAGKIKNGTVEIMVHPVFNEQNELVDTLDQKPLQQFLPPISKNPNAKKTS
jgi:predicted glycoside hydrolase/deacetylase ChbG (UPF0249 family)